MVVRVDAQTKLVIRQVLLNASKKAGGKRTMTEAQIVAEWARQSVPEVWTEIQTAIDSGEINIGEDAE